MQCRDFSLCATFTPQWPRYCVYRTTCSVMCYAFIWFLPTLYSSIQTRHISLTMDNYVRLRTYYWLHSWTHIQLINFIYKIIKLNERSCTNEIRSIQFTWISLILHSTCVRVCCVCMCVFDDLMIVSHSDNLVSPKTKILFCDESQNFTKFLLLRTKWGCAIQNTYVDLPFKEHCDLIPFIINDVDDHDDDAIWCHMRWVS